MVDPAALHIYPIDLRVPSRAVQVHALHMRAYRQEADLLGGASLPPLERSVAELAQSPDSYFAAMDGAALLGVISIALAHRAKKMWINSLTVEPSCQRRGVGRQLLAFALAYMPQCCDFTTACVATGAQNRPAIALYEAYGFTAYAYETVGLEAIAIVKLQKIIGI